MADNDKNYINDKDYIIIVAAGGATRFGKDKLFADLNGRPLIFNTVKTAQSVCDNVILVTNADNRQKIRRLFGDTVIYADGGETRAQSVSNGLALLPDDARLVAIHDGARPYASPSLYKKTFEQAAKKGSAVPTVALTDTAYSVTDENTVPLNRDECRLAQTPQVFDAKKLKAAYAASKIATTDDGQIWLSFYGSVNLTEGERGNVKITYPSDLKKQKTGVGFDVHRLTEGRKLTLCGVQVPFDKGLDGHSDADVGVHALIDAVLCATGMGDIGKLFPDTDDRYKDIDSCVLLKTVVELARQKGYSLVNAGIEIVAQSPKLSPFVAQMRKKISDVTGIHYDDVNVAATTTENLGVTAEGKGIAAFATVLVTKTE